MYGGRLNSAEIDNMADKVEDYLFELIEKEFVCSAEELNQMRTDMSAADLRGIASKIIETASNRFSLSPTTEHDTASYGKLPEVLMRISPASRRFKYYRIRRSLGPRDEVTPVSYASWDEDNDLLTVVEQKTPLDDYVVRTYEAISTEKAVQLYHDSWTRRAQ